MTKKQFIALADHIKEHNRVANHPANKDSMQAFSNDQLDTLARFCASQNVNFMRERWFGYIEGSNGPNGGSIK